MAAPEKQINQFRSLLSRDTQIYLIVLRNLFHFCLFGPDDPLSPPQLMCPFQEVETFDRNISNKMHDNLVTDYIHPKIKQGFRLAFL